MPTADAVVLISCSVFMLAVVTFTFRWQYLRAHQVLKSWARRKDYQIVHQKYRWFRLGPYWWTHGSQPVFRVAVVDRHGRERTGWVRCGDYPCGLLLSDEVRVTWDDAPYV